MTVDYALPRKRLGRIGRCTAPALGRSVGVTRLQVSLDAIAGLATGGGPGHGGQPLALTATDPAAQHVTGTVAICLRTEPISAADEVVGLNLGQGHTEGRYASRCTAHRAE